uniref:Uroporphyrinogen decarboxylase (URO-D) domain-containing protein n=1 Tax=Glossina pallidipes TaxID=7398 RepID=A0A1A9Z1B2_GLOPL
MGMHLTFLNDFGPCFLNPIQSRFDMEKLIIPHPEEHMHYVLKIIQTIPVTVFTKNSNGWLKDIVTSGCDVIALDWSVDMELARKQVGKHVSLQGNMDPYVLYSENSYIQKETDLILSQFGFGEGHIFSLGHGILPDTDPKKVQFLVDSVHQLSKKYHQKIY